MCRRRVLLLVDFSSQAYGAQHVVLRMQSSLDLHVVLLVLGTGGRCPSPSLSRFVEMMAQAHSSGGGTAEVMFAAREDPRESVRETLRRSRFDLVVAGKNLAGCRGRDDVADWLLVDSSREPLASNGIRTAAFRRHVTCVSGSPRRKTA